MPKVDIKNLVSAIEKELTDFGNEVASASKNAVQEVAEETKTEIQDSAPVDRGKYKRGWKVKTSFENATERRDTIYNSSSPGLTHLLEFGHAKVNGGRVAAQPHIAPATENLDKKLADKIKQNLSKG